MGDFNAKVGSDNRGYEKEMSRHTLGQMNENKEKFATLCGLYGLVVVGNIFAHKRLHKALWVSDDLTMDNQIDYIYPYKRLRRSLQDVRVRRGVDAETDHYLLTVKIQLR